MKHLTALLPVALLALASAPCQAGDFEPGARIWTANITDSTVSVVDPALGTVKTISVGSSPISLAAAPNGRYVFVAAHTAASVDVIDRKTLKVAHTIQLEGMPYWVTVSPDGSKVYVTITGGSDLKVISTRSMSVVGSLKVGSAPVAAKAVAGGLLLVANSGSNDVSIIDMRTDKALARIPVGQRPVWVEPSADGRLAFVANSGSKSVSIIDLARRQVVASVPIGGSPTGIVLTAGERRFMTVDHTGSRVKLFDVATRRCVKTLDVGKKPIGFAVANSGVLLLASTGSNELIGLDAEGKTLHTWTVGKGPRGILVLGESTPASRYAWLTSTKSSLAAGHAQPKTGSGDRHAGMHGGGAHSGGAAKKKGGLQLRGSVVYTGKCKGDLRIVLHRHEPPAGPPVGYKTFKDVTFPFSFEIPVPRAGKYYIRASLDVDPSDGTYPKRALDPQNVPGKTPAAIAGRGSSPVRVVLCDPVD